MAFGSLTFLLYFPLVFALYWLCRSPRRQNLVLVAASYVFYGWWDYRFCALMLASSLIDYGVGLAMTRTEDGQRKKAWLWVSVCCNLGLLGFFKYFNFFAENLTEAAAKVGWQLNTGTLEILLPVGISFYTFQTLSYTIDIYRGKLKPTSNLIDYLAFVSFFPQLVAGPIERATNLLPQFLSPRKFDYEVACDGCRQMLWGFFKKLVIADRLVAFVDATYADSGGQPGTLLALATVCFAFQIYCDFSAYSDIAIGTAKLFNIRLMRNFAYPYFSQSVTEFWRRWHISLSTWFRDYVYLPLGGNRASTPRWAMNIVVTFLISGLWHGAAWKFLIWGGIHGLAVVVEKTLLGTRSVDDQAPGGTSLVPGPLVVLRMLATFVVVCVCWVFFRAESLPQAGSVLYAIGRDLFSTAAYSALLKTLDGNEMLQATLMLTALLLVVEWAQRTREHPLELESWPTSVQWGTYTLLLWGGLYFMPTNSVSPFIYFTF
ncbi:MAG: MBOAT family protein [Planctomycetales bacterium]